MNAKIVVIRQSIAGSFSSMLNLNVCYSNLVFKNDQLRMMERLTKNLCQVQLVRKLHSFINVYPIAIEIEKSQLCHFVLTAFLIQNCEH